MQSPRASSLFQCVLGAALLACGAARADENLTAACNTEPDDPRIPAAGWQINWENDAFVPVGNTDNGYSQGFRFGYRFRPEDQPSWLSKPMAALCRRIAAQTGHPEMIGTGTVFVGQQLFTPNDRTKTGLIKEDRPYGAWLYVGARIDIAQPYEGERARTGMFHSYELQVGTLGPRANGEWVQNNAHRYEHNEEFMGWDNQLPNEFGVQGIYRTRAMLAKWSVGGEWETDAIADGELSLGTIQMAAGMGGNLRFGRGLSDPVTEPLGPTKSASFRGADPNSCLDGPWILALKECYVFVGANARYTGFDAFLDGTLFHGGHSVDRYALTYDWSWGFRLRWSRFQLDYSLIRRSREFDFDSTYAGVDGKHSYGSASLKCFAPIGGQTKRWDLVCPAIFLGMLGVVADAARN